jgi:hypothetical protein
MLHNVHRSSTCIVLFCTRYFPETRVAYAYNFGNFALFVSYRFIVSVYSS